MIKKLLNVLLIWCQMSACLAVVVVSNGASLGSGSRVISTSGTTTAGNIYAGITNFLGLTDTPFSYAGANGKYLTVGDSGIVFTTLPTSYSGTVTSVGISVDNGLAASGSPITTNGIIALTIDQSALQAAIDTDTQLSQEQVEDYVGSLITNGSNVTTFYDDVTGTLTISSTGGGGGGTVTSVAVNNGDPFTTITGSPITTSGTITIDFDEASFLQNANNLSDLNSASTARSNLGVAIGSDVQAWDADLDNWALNNGSEIQATGSGGFTIKSSDGSNNLALGSGGSPNATAYGGWNFDGATANTIASFGATKTLTSLSTATYPSLTELSYVKGVTSSIQTQFTGKQNQSNNLDTLSTNDGSNLTGVDAATLDTIDSTGFLQNGAVTINSGNALLGISNGVIQDTDIVILTPEANLSAYTNDVGFLTSESDPQVDSVTSGNFCKGTGTTVSCTDSNTYLTTEVDGSTTNEIQNIFAVINGSTGTNIVASSSSDIVYINGGTDISVTTNGATNNLDIAFTNASGYITGNETITLSGDVTGTGTTSIVTIVGNDSHSHTSSTLTLASTDLTDTADLLYETELDSEAELEAQLSDVTNVFTNNDGALSDDDLSNNDTDDLVEGVTNLYFTNTRADTRITNAIGTTVQAYSSNLDILSLNNGKFLDLIPASAITSGSFPDARIDNDITLTNITQITNRSHTSLSDIGTNTHAQIDTHIADATIHFTEVSIDHGSIAGLADDDHTQYHNDSRALTWLGTRSTTDLSEGTNLYFTDERVDDRVNGLLLEGSNVTLLYDDSLNTLTVSATDTTLSQEQVEDYVGAMVSSNTESLITVTYQDADGTLDFEVDNDLANYSNVNSAFLTSEVDGSTTNEIQNIFATINGSTGTDITASTSSDTVYINGGTDISVTTNGATNNLDIAFTNASGYITGNETITLSGDASGSGTTAITVTIANDSHNHTNSSITLASTDLTDTTDLLYETELDSESELETQLADVTNVFTNNDGALSDDDLSNNDTDDLSEGSSNFYYTNARFNADLLEWLPGNNGSLLTTVNGALAELTVGTDQYVLKVNGDKLAWEPESAGGGASAIDDLLDASTSTDSVYLGLGSGANSSANTQFNVAIGINALNGAASSLSDDNTVIGYEAGKVLGNSSNQVLGSDNTIIGYQAGDAMNNASSNVAIGHSSMGALTTGSSNIAIGKNSLASNTTGSQNVFIGDSAGTTYTGTNTIAIGNAITPPNNNNNQLLIGSSSTPTIYGNISDRNIGIGNTMTTEKLNIEGAIALAEISAPSLTSGYGKLYTLSTDSNLYFLDDSGTSYDLLESGSGDNISIDSSAVVDPDFVSTGDIDFVDTSNTITANINAGVIIEPDLDADNAPTDGDILTYDSTGTNFAWITPNAGTDITADLEEEAHCSEHDSADVDCSGETIILASRTSSSWAGNVTDETGTGAWVFANSPTLVTPALGTPSSATLTNATGLPLTTGVTGTLPVANGGTGRTTGTTAYALIATGTTVTGAQQTLGIGGTTQILVGGGASALPVWTTATGSGAPVRATSPTLVTPALGTPSSGDATNLTNLNATQLTSGTVPAARVGSSHIDAAAEIASDIIQESHLKAVNAATDEYCLTYEATIGDFEWQACGSGSGDVTDVYDCSTGDCNSMTIATGEKLDGGTATVDATGEGIILPRGTSCTAATDEGHICWDTDDDTLYIGDGSAATAITGGGGASTFDYSFNAIHAKLPSSNPCIIYNPSAAVVDYIRCDDSTDESVTWSTVLEPFNSGTIKAEVFYSMVSATSGNVVLNISLMCVTPGDSADLDTESFAAVGSATDAVPGTAGYLDSVTITPTDDSCAAGDMLIVKFNRDANNASDTASGDIEVRKVRVYEE